MSTSDHEHRVLVIDDDPDMLYVVRDVLEDEGLAVDTAADGYHAIAIAEARRPDLVIVDVTLPTLDSRDVVARLRDDVGDSLPVLVVTAGGGAREKAKRLAAYAYLHKPFDLNQLVLEVWRGLE